MAGSFRKHTLQHDIAKLADALTSRTHSMCSLCQCYGISLMCRCASCCWFCICCLLALQQAVMISVPATGARRHCAPMTGPVEGCQGEYASTFYGHQDPRFHDGSAAWCSCAGPGTTTTQLPLCTSAAGHHRHRDCRVTMVKSTVGRCAGSAVTVQSTPSACVRHIVGDCVKHCSALFTMSTDLQHGCDRV